MGTQTLPLQSLSRIFPRTQRNEPYPIPPAPQDAGSQTQAPGPTECPANQTQRWLSSSVMPSFTFPRRFSAFYKTLLCSVLQFYSLLPPPPPPLILFISFEILAIAKYSWNLKDLTGICVVVSSRRLCNLVFLVCLPGSTPTGPEGVWVMRPSQVPACSAHVLQRSGALPPVSPLLNRGAASWNQVWVLTHPQIFRVTVRGALCP